VDPKYATKLGDLDRAVLESAGTLDPAIRKAAAEGAPVPEALAGYVDKVRRHAYRVSDGDVERLLGAGYSQDQIFEATVAAAFGAARARLRAGMDSMGAWGPSGPGTEETGR
jgi:alkylhydroperoxidase family enzyme